MRNIYNKGYYPKTVGHVSHKSLNSILIGEIDHDPSFFLENEIISVIASLISEII